MLGHRCNLRHGCKLLFRKWLLLVRQSQLTPSPFYTIEFTSPRRALHQHIKTGGFCKSPGGASPVEQIVNFPVWMHVSEAFLSAQGGWEALGSRSNHKLKNPGVRRFSGRHSFTSGSDRTNHLHSVTPSEYHSMRCTCSSIIHGELAQINDPSDSAQGVQILHMWDAISMTCGKSL